MNMEKLSNEELELLCSEAQRIMTERRDKRYKELWENVVAAIKKYQDEIGDIEVHNYNCDMILDCDKLDKPGFLYGF